MHHFQWCTERTLRKPSSRLITRLICGSCQACYAPPPRTLFYGWIVTACAFLVLFLTYGVQYSFGVFLPAMLDDLGWQRASLAGAFSLYTMIYSVGGGLMGEGREMTQQLEGLIDLPALEGFLREHLPRQEGELVVEKHEAGFSNETFYVSWGLKRWVMRRPPRGDILPTAHDVLREYRVLSALAPTGVRVPRPAVACEDRAVIGAPFYLMERVDGVVIRDDLPPEFDASSDRRRIGEELIDALVELHSVEWQSTSLSNIGKPQGFLERQLRRWIGQLDLTLPHTRQLPGIHAVTEWLRTHLPPQSGAGVVHGDYKLDNVMFAAHRPARLIAIFDWEMATLGDPLTDLGWLIAYWGPTGDPPDPEPKGSNYLTEQQGFLSREEMIARYEEKTSRKMTHFPFYHCLAVWKQAIILEGLYRHYLEGTAANPKAAEFEWKVPQLVERAHRIIAAA